MQVTRVRTETVNLLQMVTPVSVGKVSKEPFVKVKKQQRHTQLEKRENKKYIYISVCICKFMYVCMCVCIYTFSHFDAHTHI